MRHVHRHLPGGRADQRHVSLQDAAWEMEHVGTICTHCANGCKTTLGVRNDKIIRGNNRDRSGINGEFLCVKGRYAFDFDEHPERLQSPLLRVNGKLEPVSWSKALEAVAAKFQRSQGARRQVRRHRLESHHQRRELLPAEVRAPGAGDEQYRSSSHRRCGHAARCAERPDRRARHHARSVREESRAGRRRRSGAAASVPLVPDPRQFPASPGARLRGHGAAGARGQLRRGERARRAGRGTGGRRIAARQAEGRAGAGDPVRRCDQGRRRPQAGRVRRFARHSGEVRSAWSIIRTRAARSTWG